MQTHKVLLHDPKSILAKTRILPRNSFYRNPHHSESSVQALSQVTGSSISRCSIVKSYSLQRSSFSPAVLNRKQFRQFRNPVTERALHAGSKTVANI